MDETTDDSMDLVIDATLLNEIDVEKEAASFERGEQSCSTSNGVATSFTLTNQNKLSPQKQVVAPEKRIGPPDISDDATNSPKPERKRRRGYAADGKEEQVPEMNFELQQGFRILRELLSDANKSLNSPFLEEIDVEKLGLWDYEEKIEQPMWLKKMKEKFITGHYDSITQFVSDFRMMLENCYRYNGPDHYVSKKGQKLEQVMEQKLSLLSRELREKTTLDATKTKASMSSGVGDYDFLDFKGIRRRGRVIQPHDSTVLLNQLRKEEALKEKEYRRQQVLERKQEKEQYYHDLVKWDETVMGGAEGVAQMKAMWELPNIGLFLFLCQEPLRLYEVPQFELERAIYIPRESNAMQRIMTALLRTQSQRVRDERKPLFTYRQWNFKLKARLQKWYKTVEDKKSEEMASRVIGIDPRLFRVLGKMNPMEKKWFHELTPYQRVWVVKAICDNNLEIQETLREAIECNALTDQKAYLLGTDGDGYTYIHFPQFCGQDLRIYRQAPFKYPKFDRPKPVPEKVQRSIGKKSAPVSPKKSPVKKKRVSELPSTPTNRPSRLRQVIKPVLKPSTPETSDIEDDVQSLSSYCSSVDTRAARALRREQFKGIQMVHSKQNLERMFEKERTVTDLLDGEDTSMDCDSPTPSKTSSLRKSLRRVRRKSPSDDAQSESGQDDEASVDTESHLENGDGDDTVSSIPGCFQREQEESEVEKMDTDSLLEKSDASCSVPNNDDSASSDKPGTDNEPFPTNSTSVGNKTSNKVKIKDHESGSLNGDCDSDIVNSSVNKSVDSPEGLHVKSEQDKDDEISVPLASIPSAVLLNGERENIEIKQEPVSESNEPGAFQGIGTSDMRESVPSVEFWDTTLRAEIIVKKELDDDFDGNDEVSNDKQEPFQSYKTDSPLEMLEPKKELLDSLGGDMKIKTEPVDGAEFVENVKIKQEPLEDVGVDSVKDATANTEEDAANMEDDDDDDDDVRIIGEKNMPNADEEMGDRDVMIIEKPTEEEMIPPVPDVKDFELIGDTVEILRNLVKQFEEPEAVPVMVRKGKKDTVIKPPLRKKCVGDLYERLVYLLKELEPWETKLIQANRKMRERVKKEVDDFVEPVEPDEITIGDDSSTSNSDDSSDDDSDSDSSSESSSDNKAAKKDTSKQKLEEVSDTESISLRGRTRKRRKIPDNAADEYESSVTRKKAKKVPPSTANESKAKTQTAIQSAIKNLRLPANHVLIKTSQGYSIVNSALLQNPQFCAALNPTIIRTVAATTAAASSSAGTGKVVMVQNLTAPVVRTVTSTVPLSDAQGGARSVLIQQLSKPLPESSAPNVVVKKVTTISAIPITTSSVKTITGTPVPPKPAQRTENYVRYSGLPDMPQHVVQELIKKQRKGVMTEELPTTTPAAKILSSMLNAPDTGKDSSVRTNVTITQAPQVATTTSIASNIVTSVLSLSSVTQPINRENWNALLNANPGLIKLVQSPQKSSRYASNITVKSLLETRASQQKSPKSEPGDPMHLTIPSDSKPLTVVVTEHQDVMMRDVLSLQTTLPDSSHIDQMVKSVLSPIKTSLPTVQIKIPSPSTLPAMTQHNVTSTTRAMKVPIPAAILPTASTKNTSPVVKVQNTNSLSVPGAVPAGAKMIASIIGGEQKNIVLKVVPQTIMTTQGLVQGYVTPQGLFIPKEMLNTPAVLAVNPDGSPATATSVPNSQVLNTANQTVKAIVSPGTVQTKTEQGNLLQVVTNPAVTSHQKIVINRAVVSGSQAVNSAQGHNLGGLLPVPTTLPLTAVPLSVNNRGVVVQKRVKAHGGIMTTAVRKPVMTPTIARPIEFTEANNTSAISQVSPVTTYVSSPSERNLEQMVSIGQQVPLSGVISTPNVQGLFTTPNVQRVVPNQSVQGVVPTPNVQRVVATQSIQGIVPTPNVLGLVPNQSVQGVVPTPNVQRVVPTQSIHGIVPTPNVLGVVPTQSIQGVVQTPNVQGVVPTQHMQGVVRNENILERSSPSLSGGFGDISSIFSQTTDADTVAALQSLVQLSGLVPPEPNLPVSSLLRFNSGQAPPTSDAPLSYPTNQSGLVSPDSNISQQILSSVNLSTSETVPQDSLQSLRMPKVIKYKQKPTPRGNIGLKGHAAAYGLEVQKPDGGSVYTVNIAKTDQVSDQNISPDVTTSPLAIIRSDQIVSTPSQKSLEVKLVNSQNVQPTSLPVVTSQNQQCAQTVTMNNQMMQVKPVHAIGNTMATSSGQPVPPVSVSWKAVSTAPGVLGQSIGVPAQGALTVADQAASLTSLAANVPLSPLSNITTQQHGNSDGSNVQQAVVGQTASTPAGQQKLILFNIGGHLVTPQGIPVTISQGVVKMLPKSLTATSSTTALKQAQLQLALQQLQAQQGGQLVTGLLGNTPAKPVGQSQEAQLQQDMQVKPQTTTQILQSQLSQVQLLNQLKRPQPTVQVVQSSQAQAQPLSSLQEAQKPVTVQVPQQQFTLQQNLLQQVVPKSQSGQVIPRSNIVMQVLPQSLQQTGQVVQNTAGVQQVQLATGAQVSVHGGVHLGQQVVGGVKPIVQPVQVRAGAPSSGQQVLQLGQLGSVQPALHTIKTGQNVQQVVQLGQQAMQQIPRSATVPTSVQTLAGVPISRQQVLQLGQLGTVQHAQNTVKTGQNVQQVVQLGQPTASYQQTLQQIQRVRARPSAEPNPNPNPARVETSRQQMLRLGQLGTVQQAQHSVKSTQNAQQVVQLGQPTTYQVKHGAGVSTSGQHVQQVVIGQPTKVVPTSVQPGQHIVSGIQLAPLVAGVQLAQQPRPVQLQSQNAVQVLQQASLASSPGAQPQLVQVQQPGQTVFRFDQLQKMVQLAASAQQQQGTGKNN